jgi:2-oxoglutarate dehydrogenase complex dehydrogenase (E1) component-like enzyme
MGAWSFVLPKLRKYNIQLISRDESAATASGSTKDSQHKQQLIIDKVFNNIK